MTARTWRRRSFLRAVGLAGLAPLAPRSRSRARGAGRATSPAPSRPIRCCSAGAASTPIGSIAMHASRAACPRSCGGRSTATVRRCTNASASATATGSRAMAWCTRIASTDADSPTAPGCSLRPSSPAKVQCSGGSTPASRHPWSAGRGCTVPTTSTPPTSPCSTITASSSRCGKEARRACSTGTHWHGSASRCGASASRACPSPRIRRWSPTALCGPSVTASLPARPWCSTTSPRTARC